MDRVVARAPRDDVDDGCFRFRRILRDKKDKGSRLPTARKSEIKFNIEGILQTEMLLLVLPSQICVQGYEQDPSVPIKVCVF